MTRLSDFDILSQLTNAQAPVRSLVSTNVTTISSSTSETTILAAQASTYLDLTHVIVANTSQVAVRVDFRDDTAGTVRFSLNLAPTGSASLSFSRAWPQTASNKNWTAQCSAAVTDVRIAVMAIENSS